MTSRASQVTSPPANPFRLWTPPDESEGRSPADPGDIGSMTLRDIYSRFRVPILRGDRASKATLSDYDVALKRWEENTSSEDSSGNPTASQIGQEIVDQFRAVMADHVEAGDFSGATVNKYFRYLRTLLNHLGPRSRKNPRAVRFWTEVPFLEPVAETEPDPVEIPDSDLDALYRFSSVATWPPPKRTGVPAPIWWQASQVVLVNCAMRRDDWLYLKPDSIDWRQGYLTFVARKTKKMHCLAMHSVVIDHLQMLRQGGEYLFCPTQSHVQLYRQWHEIQAAAKIKGPDGRPYGFHSLRQTAASRFHAEFPGTAELLLGHALPKGKQVTAKHYLGRRLLQPLWKAQLEIAQPPSYRIDPPADRLSS